jgi:hypothetical protein
MLNNRTLLEKADLALSDLTTDGGLLEPEQATRFVRLLIKQSRAMQTWRTLMMNSPKRLVETLRFGGRVLKPGVSATALSVLDRSKPDLTKVELDAQLLKAEVRLNNEVLEDSIERASLRNTIMQTLADAVSRDLEFLLINGDTASANPLLAVLDGVLKQITTNTVAFGTNPTDKDLWLAMLKKMPSEFLVRDRLRFYTSIKSDLDYRNSLSERATELGDDKLVKMGESQFQTVPILPVPEWPENLGAGTNETTPILTDPENIVVGFHRQMRLETDRDITAGEFIIVMSMRVDVKLAHEPAAVKATGVLAA